MHPWFKDINWTEIIERKAQKIPYIPDCTEIPATSISEIEAQKNAEAIIQRFSSVKSRYNIKDKIMECIEEMKSENSSPSRMSENSIEV